jgi:flagellar biosynthesis protein FlhG
VPRVIAVTSGKGGVGKTNVSVNLAILLAQRQHRVLLFDADLGLANVDVLLGLHPDYTLQHVLYGERELVDVLVTGPCDVKIIPGASGMVELANLNDAQRGGLIECFSRLGDETDIVLVDTSPGVSRNVISFAAAADEVIVLTTPDPTAVMDAYAIIKAIARENLSSRIHLLVNMVQDEQEACEVAQKIILLARQFLNVTVEAVGGVPTDRSVAWAVRQQEPFVLAYPRSAAAESLRLVAGHVERSPTWVNGSMSQRDNKSAMGAISDNPMKKFLEKMGAALGRRKEAME